MCIWCYLKQKVITMTHMHDCCGLCLWEYRTVYMFTSPNLLFLIVFFVFDKSASQVCVHKYLV